MGIKTALLCSRADSVSTVYGKGRRQRLGEVSDLYPELITLDNFSRHAANLAGVEALFSTWGMPALGEEHFSAMPSLKAVFYAAGSVRGFAGPLLDRGIQVVSSWAANAVPVAEFTLAQILLSTKGYFPNTRASASPETRGSAYRGPGNYGETVSLLGAGMIGRNVIELLSPVTLKIVVWDPYFTVEEASELNVEKVETLEEAFERGIVVSNHLANVTETQGLLTGELFSRMRPHAAFINTGRGQTVVEDEMIDVLRKRPDLTALLDVTHPEPPDEGSLLYKLPNVSISSHIAGSIGDEVVRMADYVLDEFHAWEAGLPLRYEVTTEMLKTMA